MGTKVMELYGETKDGWGRERERRSGWRLGNVHGRKEGRINQSTKVLGEWR